MDEVTKLLDGSVDEVKAGLSGLSHDDLLRLKAGEEGGKNRKGAMEAIDAALADADTQRAGGRVTAAPGLTEPPAIAAGLDPSPGADIAPADGIDTSGAPQQIVPAVDMTHPAVDADPRAGTTEQQNRIDFNDPARSGREVVEDALSQRG
ncbi:MAG: hypothetical protein DI530_12290 [Sphingomonas sp.]|uniref:hypothetical protein n=1 Tax=Sphingomonas sp. TaxID=28214 RepID=UPI000DBC3270|nr:hypothetical protein [Sphingomonas sp.]PZU77764.1 MAG: hypothetical protein DI530_12290 [Sphingomonas sp.]